MKILIAEDDMVSRRLLKADLQKWGYDVTAVSDGDSALEILTGDNAPTLAVLDWLMPGQDGVCVCNKVRQQENGRFIYIILYFLLLKVRWSILWPGWRPGPTIT